MENFTNSQSAIQKRKCQETLKLCGTATIVFAFWAIVKFFMQLITGNTALMAAFEKVAEVDASIRAIVIVTIVLFIAFVILLRVYVWISSIRIVNEKKKGTGLFLPITILLLLIDILMIAVELAPLFSLNLDLSGIMETLVDMTSAILLVILLIQTFKLKKITRRIAQEVE